METVVDPPKFNGPYPAAGSERPTTGSTATGPLRASVSVARALHSSREGLSSTSTTWPETKLRLEVVRSQSGRGGVVAKRQPTDWQAEQEKEHEGDGCHVYGHRGDRKHINDHPRNRHQRQQQAPCHAPSGERCSLDPDHFGIQVAIARTQPIDHPSNWVHCLLVPERSMHKGELEESVLDARTQARPVRVMERLPN